MTFDPDPDLAPDPRWLTDAATERKVAVNKLITHVVLVRINRSTEPELLSITSDVKLATGAKLVMKQSTLRSHPGTARFFFKPSLARTRLRPIITTLMNRSVLVIRLAKNNIGRFRRADMQEASSTDLGNVSL